MKYYISGPITGIKNHNRDAFEEAGRIVLSHGHIPVNPLDSDSESASTEWVDYLKKDLKLIADCQAIVCLEGWENSKGARLEVATAFQLGMPIHKVFKDSTTGTAVMLKIMHRTDRGVA